MNFKKHLDDFDNKFQSIDSIDREFHKRNIGVISFSSKANTRDSFGNFSEEYIRTRFVYALVKSGLFPKEVLCIEFSIPKGNNAKSLKPDIIAFKNKDWLNKN